MHLLTSFFVKRPLIVNLIMAALILLGIKTVSSIQKEGFPAAELNEVIVSTIYPGAAAREVEINVTQHLEEELFEVSNVKEIKSISSEGASRISVTADDDLSAKHFAKVYDDIGNALNRVNDLPNDIDGPPTYFQITTDDMPIVQIAVGGPKDTLRSFIPLLEERLRRVTGVAKVDLVGFPDEEIHILVDAKQAEENYIDLQSVTNAIKRRNLEGSGGTIESYLGEKKVVAYNKFTSPNELYEMNLRRSFEGKGVKLKDIARIVRGEEDLKLRVHNGGAPGVSVLVRKKSTADTLDTLDRVKAEISSIQLPEGLTISYLDDKGRLTRNRLQLLGSNAAIGVGIIIVLLVIALGGRTAFWTAASIPFSLLAAFIFLPTLGLTLNALTLGGCVLVLGMLVDDAIVIAEQVSHEKELGAEPLAAAVSAVRKVWQPVVGGSLTTMLAYYPLTQLGGLPGKFIWVLPVVVIIALLVSLFDSFFLLPCHLCHGAASTPKKRKFIVLLEKCYEWVLRPILKLRYLILILFICLLIFAANIASTKLVKDPFPQDAAEGFSVQLTQQAGLTFDQAEESISIVEGELAKLPDNELVGFSTRIGMHTLDPGLDRGSQANLATIFVYLTPYNLRARTADQIKESVRKLTASLLLERDTLALYELIRIGPPLGRAFEILISSGDDSLRKERTEEIKEFIAAIPGVFDVDDDRVAGKPEVNLSFDFNRMSELGLSVDDILGTLRIAYDGRIVSDILQGNKSIDIRVKLENKGEDVLKLIKELSIKNQKGRLIKLEQLTSFEEKTTTPEIIRINGKRTTTVFGQLDKNLSTPADIVRLVNVNFPSDNELQVSFAGEAEENQKIFADLGVAALVALLGVFLVLAIILDSLLRPLVVMAAIPFGMVGAIFAAWANDMALSMFVMVSIIGLAGVMVNDSLVMVNTILRLKGDGALTREHVIQGAVRRLRPIMLTTLTTVFGILPTAYGFGGWDPFISPMCLALGWGLLFGTMVVLVLLPSLYSIGLDFHKVCARK